jgi:heme-degrading monooxygenase HmoA
MRENQMVFIFNVTTKESTRDEFISAFEMMKAVPGFQSISLFQEQSNPNKFTCVEFWDNKKSHAQHVKEISDDVRKAWLSLLEEVSPMQFYERIKELSLKR